MVTKLIVNFYRAVRRQLPKKEDPIGNFRHELPAEAQKEIEIIKKRRKDKNLANIISSNTPITTFPAQNSPKVNIRNTQNRKIERQLGIIIPIQYKKIQLEEKGKFESTHPNNMLPFTKAKPGNLKMPEKIKKTSQAPKIFSPVIIRI
ncbi:hypothetical protein MA16_Dca007479 [Dendrobium catenatum]|uniref:Uncharacterized protein n=1 Tax=Dendrobium catenatum TaxID=906689 RepID=A0A2I0WB84_9ASPA|nr:hypothetical protein MA16_Dca007479 [Dendrobium catenatum]